MLPFEKYQIRFEDIEQARNKYRIIDVRSPLEFAEDALPGAVNLPVLDNAERAAVGTLYKTDQFAARELGARLVSANIARILDPVAAFHRDERRPFVLYCWRGGMRSRSLFTVMHMIGYRTHLLAGGYQAYRRRVQHELYAPSLEAVPLIVHGYTGSGKTGALGALKAEGIPVVDLEGCANHRGSLLGQMPGGQPSQKQFETAIYESLPRHGFFLVEGESRKIGRLSIPPGLWHSMAEGLHIWLEVPRAARARQCAEDYASHPDLKGAVGRISGLSGKDRERVNALISAGENEQAALILLEQYYDPLYRRHGPAHSPERYALTVSASEPSDLVAELGRVFGMAEELWIKKRSSQG